MSTPDRAENPFAGQGSVLLDIGEDVGAVVVVMPETMEGVEVEIRPDHPQLQRGHAYRTHHPHVAVVNRPVEGGQLPSLVFAEVEQGSYGLYLKGTDHRQLDVRVVGGEVAVVDWPA